MIDQMPDEVWLRRIGTWVQQPEGEHRYIRADLYDSKACPHVVGGTTQHCTLAQDEVRRLTQRAEQAEAERGRLRTAVSEAKRRIDIYMDDECSYDETLEMGIFVLDAFARAQEALDHDD